jgi:hypothetical protein
MNPDMTPLKSTKSVCIASLLMDCAGAETLLFRMITTTTKVRPVDPLANHREEGMILPIRIHQMMGMKVIGKVVATIS